MFGCWVCRFSQSTKNVQNPVLFLKGIPNPVLGKYISYAKILHQNLKSKAIQNLDFLDFKCVLYLDPLCTTYLLLAGNKRLSISGCVYYLSYFTLILITLALITTKRILGIVFIISNPLAKFS